MDVGSMAAVAIQLSTTGRAVGLVSRVVAQSPGSGEHLYAIHANDGRALAYAHDAFQAARLFIDFESDSELPTHAIRMLPDAELSQADKAERFDEYGRGYYVMTLDYQRARLAEARGGFVTRLGRRART